MKIFETDCVDKGFREAVKKVISKAQDQVIVITGEFSALNFYHDLQLLLDDVFHKKEIRLKVFMTNENYGIINKIFFLNPGRTEVYIGTKGVEDHYLICDDKYFVHTFEHERNISGVRTGEYEDEDPDKGRRYIDDNGLIRLFNELIEQSDVRKITGPDMSKDPLYADPT